MPGLANRAYVDLVHTIPTQPAPMLVHVDSYVLPGSYVTASTPHVAFMAPETMVVPFPSEREKYLQEAWTGAYGGLAGLGLDYVIIHRESDNVQDLKNQGWQLVKEEAYLGLYRAPHPEPGLTLPLP